VSIVSRFRSAKIGANGFRPGRSPHQALDALSVALTRKRVNYVLDCDIRGFFDTLSHEW
jgi:RNA-directed DNA polymerase